LFERRRLLSGGGGNGKASGYETARTLIGVETLQMGLMDAPRLFR